jgi:hypothetical protein
MFLLVKELIKLLITISGVSGFLKFDLPDSGSSGERVEK